MTVNRSNIMKRLKRWAETDKASLNPAENISPQIRAGAYGNGSSQIPAKQNL